VGTHHHPSLDRKRGRRKYCQDHLRRRREARQQHYPNHQTDPELSNDLAKAKRNKRKICTYICPHDNVLKQPKIKKKK